MMYFTSIIDAASLAGLLAHSAGSAASRLVVLDCRFDLAAPRAGSAAYARSHIPHAEYADLNEMLADSVSPHSGRHPLPSPGVMAQRCEALGIGGDVQVIAYDDAGGAFAARAWWLLRWLGHARVAVLDGGFKAWVQNGGAVESGTRREATPARPARFDAHVNAGAVASTSEVLQALRDPARLLVDARAAERYAGAFEPLDPVAGHIPGAVNHPYTANLDPEGRFLPAAELRRVWQARLKSATPQNVIVMCGSGVTACHNLLAMELAGLAGAQLYAGSWSEWIRDPQRPVARGHAP